MERELSISEIGRAVMIARLLMRERLALPVESKRLGGLTNDVRVLVAGSKMKQRLGLNRCAGSKTAQMRKLKEIAGILLECSGRIRNEVGSGWMFFEMIVRGNTPKALKRKINPALWLDAECAWNLIAGKVVLSVGAGPIRELLTLRT